MGWIAGWNKRIKLTISGSCIEEDLSDFPIMIHLDSTCSGVFNELGSNSKRISVVASDQSQCYVEIESWNESTKNAWLWVKVPTLTSGIDSDLYLYYDNLRPDNSTYVGTVGETPAQNVWDDYFVGVWHMNQDPSIGGACIKDSTSNGLDCTPYNMNESAVTGKIDKALDFNGSDEYLEKSDCSELDIIDNITLESTIKPDADQTVRRWPVSKQLTYGLVYGHATSTYRGCFYIGTGSSYYSGQVAISQDNYHFFVGRYDGTYLRTYLDGSQASSNNIGSQSISNTGNPLTIGSTTTTTNNFDGIIDEVRLSNTARSSAWIKATYYSNWNQLINYGIEETVSSGFLSGWSNRLKLTIQNDHVDNTLTDFPVMIKVSNSSGFNSYDNRDVFYELEADINRKKIAITDSTGTLQCFVEIERFSCAETEAVLWTKLPVIYADVGTHFYLYYDKSQADNVSFVGDVNSIVAQNVWDSNFKLVHHFAQDPSGGSGCIKDSTSNIIHGTPQGSMISGDLVDGKIGKALIFDGIDDYIKTPYNAILDLDQYVSITMEAVVDVTIGNYYFFWTIQYSLSDFVFFYIDTAGKVILRLYQYDATPDHRLWNTDVSVGAGWHTIAITHTNNVDPVFCVDGVSVAYSLDSGGGSNIKHTTDGKDSLIGCSYSEDVFTTGIQEEIRISNITRSIPWIKATYHSNWDSLIVFEKEDISAAWLSDWAHRIKLTIDHTKVDSSLVDFPVLVTLTSGVQGDFFSEMSSSDSKKIAITNSTGIAQCPVEIEQFNTIDGKVNLWTKIPTIVFDSDTDLYLYYDSSKDDNDSYVGDVGSAPARSVWDSNFVGVWHMNQDPSIGGACIKDSTSNANHGTPGGSMTAGDLVDGKIGKALDFDGSDDLINCGSATILDNIDNITFETIFKFTSYGSSNYGRIFVKNRRLYLNGVSNCVRFDQMFSTSMGRWDTPNSSITADTTYGICLTYNRISVSNNPLMYFNGISQTFSETTTPIGTVTSDDSDSLYLGNNSVASGPFDGILDETRISNIARSAPWIKATHYSNWNTLLTYGSYQNYTPPPDYYYHGYVKEKGAYVSRKIYLYRRDTGLLIDSCMSNISTGYYLLETSVSGEHFIVVLDDDAGDTYNALIEDRLYPNDM